MKKILIFITMIILSIGNVKAASLCSYKEQADLNSKAANIKTSYEIIEVETGGEDNDYSMDYYFKISITNITEDLYVVVENSFDKTERTYTMTDAKDGIVTFDWVNVEEMVNFIIKVYSSNNTNCPNEVFKTLYLTTPMYNIYSVRALCSEYTEFEYCQTFITKYINQDEFLEKIGNYINEKTPTDDTDDDQDGEKDGSIFDLIFNFFNEYKWFIIGGMAIIIITIYVIHRIKTKKQRELGL